MTPEMTTKNTTGRVYYAFDAPTGEQTNCVYIDHFDFRPCRGVVDQYSIKKDKPYHKFTQRRLDGRVLR